MRHADRHNIIYEKQHGFRRKLSCETQLTEFVNDLVNNMQEKKQSDVLVMDFDKVSHARLLIKLQKYGITGKTHKWIQGFLANRKQTVVLDGEMSYTADVISGVPQGSVLGPCLFLYYINDMPDDVKSTVRLFADDTIAYVAVCSDDDSAQLQQDLNKLADWEEKWQMKFHPEKCQVIRVTRNRVHKIESTYTLHGHKLEVVDAAKYLGITVTADLRWNKHIRDTTTKTNNSLAFFKKSADLKETAYNALVRPQIEYASSVCGSHTLLAYSI